MIIVIISVGAVLAIVVGFWIYSTRRERAIRTGQRRVQRANTVAKAWENLESDPKFRMQKAVLKVKAEQIRQRALDQAAQRKRPS